jgi:hypothetical protein
MHVGKFLRKARILASTKDKGQRTRDGGIEDGKQRSNGQEQSHKKGDTGTFDDLTGRVERFGNMEQSRERGDRGRETRSKAMRQGTEGGRQGTET